MKIWTEIKTTFQATYQDRNSEYKTSSQSLRLTILNTKKM